MANPDCHTLLGYHKNELKGKNVSILMPPPFGERHNAYVRNYISSGALCLASLHPVVPSRRFAAASALGLACVMQPCLHAARYS